MLVTILASELMTKVPRAFERPPTARWFGYLYSLGVYTHPCMDGR